VNTPQIYCDRLNQLEKFPGANAQEYMTYVNYYLKVVIEAIFVCVDESEFLDALKIYLVDFDSLALRALVTFLNRDDQVNTLYPDWPLMLMPYIEYFENLFEIQSIHPDKEINQMSRDPTLLALKKIVVEMNIKDPLIREIRSFLDFDRLDLQQAGEYLLRRIDSMISCPFWCGKVLQ
jgi:hypothetical protein